MLVHPSDNIGRNTKRVPASYCRVPSCVPEVDSFADELWRIR